MEINEIIDKLIKYRQGSDTTLLRLAYNIATKKHEGQVRVSGSAYLMHALEVANILADMQLDVVTLSAGLLHDVVEDTNVTIEEIKENLGEEIALLVEGVTKISAIQFKSSEQRQAENLRKMFLSMAKDIRVILIKLADRTHNMRTLEYLPVEKRERIARETLDIYAPLANRLGIGKIKSELEDLCFKYLYPDDYRIIKETVEKKFSDREEHIEQIKNEILELLNKLEIKASVSGRPKHFYSIFQKMNSFNKTLEEIYDLVALRITTESVKDCYGILGLVHTKYPPMPGRFKDYIATPKSNMYQSLHTTIISPYGDHIEIQIRTSEMHRIAEEGIAAHWRYKEDGKIDEKFSKNIMWLRQLIEWQKELRNPSEFMDALKVDLFKNEVYIFTPKGAVKELPEGATPVDFAYEIHTDVGHRCVGARVNNKMVPLRYKLKNGDMVEIITSETRHPSKDWLNFVKTYRAKSKIRQWIKQQEYEMSVTGGEKLLTDEILRELKHFNIESNLETKLKELNNYLAELGFETKEELYANIIYNKNVLHQILEKLFPQRRRPEAHPSGFMSSKGTECKNKTQVIIDGLNDNLMIKLARCCTPVPYDEILGFITRGRGVTIHRLNCTNVHNLLGDEFRIVKVRWSNDSTASFNVAIKARAYDRVNLLKDILSAIAETKTIISSASAKAIDKNMAICSFLVEISNIKQLDDIINRIQKVESVIKVYRADNENIGQ
ncbi:bifunctional (p)ppGpp synthetase/guanosine-3',5'-bis(diphosphate) 3'-pyrophosphohydrolase [Candidatus Poribacteria bacterium]|nr:bifunctional (p)ppGpp synthetase/guanosine-3',5'-bis(diphosphate) 3'-pyrophosphohydrolase [Candidatus Poribacteria bacterium]